MARSTGSPRRATLIASAVVVGVIVVAGAILTGRALISDDEDPSSTATPTSADSSSKCDLPDGELDKLTAAPENVEWELVNTYALPSSPAGPAEETESVHWCYAKSSEGALLAAASISVDLATPGVSYTEYAERRLTGPAVESYKQLDAAPQEQKDFLSTPNTSQIAGFQFVTVVEDQVVVQIVHRFSRGDLAGQFLVSTLDMRWENGDWRLYLDDASPSGTTVQSLAGFVEWNGA